jgi:imidazolonepropionase-like amidohydrolase
MHVRQPPVVAARRALAAQRDDVADIRAASYGASAAGGSLSLTGHQIPTLAGPQDAAPFVAARVAEGADYIKLFLEDGERYGRTSLSPDTVRAVIAAAHQHGRLTVAHTDSAATARMFIAADGDGLAHVLSDIDLSCRPRFAVATLRVTAVMCAAAAREVDQSLQALLNHPQIGPYLDPSDRQALGDPGQLTTARTAAAPHQDGRLDFAAAARSTRALSQAGTPILAGTDVNPGDPHQASPMMRALHIAGHGAALHHELELLVQAGLTPMQALASATSVPARWFGLTDRGRIAPGLRADLLLVHGDPGTDITATRGIAAIWRRGVRLDREARLTA